MMSKRMRIAALLAPAFAAAAGTCPAATIPDVQTSTAASGWGSPRAGEVLDVTGGLVTYVGTPPGKKTPRVVVQDPAFAEWAGIGVKVFGGNLADAVNVGDRVDLTNVFVDESSAGRGNTYLLFDPAVYGSAFSVTGSAPPVQPTVVSPAALGAGDASADAAAVERYEGMLLRVDDVTVGALDVGSHADNYELTGPGGTCWASDYLNLDRTGNKYHDLTVPGQTHDAVVGVLEQYTKASDAYDYYQLLTRGRADIAGAAGIIPEPSTMAALAAGACLLACRRRTRRLRVEARGRRGEGCAGAGEGNAKEPER
jgi:hypothetical protein